MKPYALHTLVCPFTHSKLSLQSFAESPVSLSDQDLERCHRLGIDPGEADSAVKEGVLYSEESGKWFPIVNYTPIMLDFPTDMHREFQQLHSSETDVFAKYGMVDGAPREGELIVQKTFTRQWDLLNLDSLSFGYTAEQRDRFVELEFDWPPEVLAKRPLDILEVGCGSGFETVTLERVTKGTVFGFDLNLALIRKGHLLYSNAFINTAVSSLFRLPVRKRSFPLVYSNGVLHHTHSTSDAFDAIEKYRAENGVICIWVYAREDCVTSARHRLRYLVEWVFRPGIAHLPAFWQKLVVKFLARRHYRIHKRLGRLSREQWTLRDSEHSVRDNWTALYANRHTSKEVITWFQNKGLRYELLDAKAYHELLGLPLNGIGIRGAPEAYFDGIAVKEPGVA